jgi:hypothetical protein
MVKKVDITGLQFNLLTAIKNTEKRTKNRVLIWLFLCKCGKYCEKNVSSVKSGATKSCGCLYKNRGIAQTQLALKKVKGEAGLGLLHSDMRYSSKRRGIEYLLTKAELKEITSKDCYYCGKVPHKIKKVNRAKWGKLETQEHGKYVYNPIDRIDSEKPYVYDNCVPCCSICNFMKHTLKLNDFKNHMIKILKYKNWNST